MKLTKVASRKRIHKRIRSKVQGTTVRPRVSVFRSNREIYAQVIDDSNGHTLVAASSREASIVEIQGNKVAKSVAVGKLLAQKALQAGFESVVFDRNGYLYHGRVKALADGAREGGLKF